MDSQTLAQTLHAAGFQLYDVPSCFSGSLSTVAESLMKNRTAYFSEETRRYFGARVLKLARRAEGLILGAIESFALPSGGRRFRAVFFDLDGNVAAQSDPEGLATKAAAERDFWRIAGALDCVAITRAMLAQKIRHMDNDRKMLAAVLDRL